MLHRQPKVADRRPCGFTLLELLVVIGIIVLLVGILLPVVRRVRISGQTVATQSLLNRIAQGCDAYFQEHHAYPGPFADDQVVYAGSTDAQPDLEHNLVSKGQTQVTVLKDKSTGAAFTHAPTSSENLFLGLCGGLRVTVPSTTTGVPVYTFEYDADLARRGLGPLSLNTTVGKKSQGYIDVTDADISVDAGRNPLNAESVASSQWWPSGSFTGNFVGDSQVFEFVDRFSRPMPVLFLRARRGVVRTGAFSTTNRTGFVFDPANAATTTPFQYDPSEAQYAYANVYAGRDKMPAANKPWSPDVIDYREFDDPNLPPTPDVAPYMVAPGNERYFANVSLSTGDATNGYTLVPVQKDRYILISAGPDGIYGTADDLRN